MDFVLNGVSRSLEPDDVRTALGRTRPEAVREHWVDVDGRQWPPKQAFALATGVDRSEFTSHYALRQLQRLGFRTSAWSGDRQGGTAAPTTPKPVQRGAPVARTGPATPQRTESHIVLIG